MNPIEKTRGIVNYVHFENIAKNAAEEKAQQEQHARELATGPIDYSKRNVNEYMSSLPSPNPTPTSAHPSNWSEPQNKTKDDWSDAETDYNANQHDPFEEYYGQDNEVSDNENYIFKEPFESKATDFSINLNANSTNFNSNVEPKNQNGMKSKESLNSSRTKLKSEKKSPNDLDSCLIHSCSLSKDKWYFVLHAKYISG